MATLPTMPLGAMTYSNLLRRTLSGEIVLRIHHSLSTSPLVMTGNPSTSGFTAPQAAFDGMAPAAYRIATRGFDGTFMATPAARQQAVEHVLDRRGLPPPGLDQDIEMMTASPFISVTADLDWALYWIARQLTGTTTPEIHLAVIRVPNAEVMLNPFPDSPMAAVVGMSEREKVAYWSARGKAEERKEWFFYGRIFDDSILGDIVFTPKVSHYQCLLT